MVGSNQSGSEVLGKPPRAQLPGGRALPSPTVMALEGLLRFGDDRKLPGDAPTTLCEPSLRLAVPESLLVDFSFPFPEKKTGKEKKKSKKVSSEGEPTADGSAEVHKKKKKKVRARPWDGVPWGELL